MTEWIRCSERLPLETGYYLCIYIFDNHRFYYDRWFEKKDNEFRTTDNITHWMPLPQPPEDK